MTDPRTVDTTPLNPPDLADDADATLRELAGEEPLDRQDGILDTDQVELEAGTVSDSELDAGGSRRSDGQSSIDDPESLELLEDLDLRSDETSDPEIAAEEGIPWVPPSDPPVVPSDDPQGVEIAAGFGTSSLDEPYDADHHEAPLTGEDEMTTRVREALRADASTTEYADALEIEAEGGRIVVRGVVEDLDDDDNIVAVVSTVSGVVEVVDELEIATLEGGPGA